MNLSLFNKSNDLSRFDDVYKKTSQMVFKYVFFRTRDIDISNDITQNVFIRVYQNLNKIRVGEEVPYIITIARNLIIDTYRKNKETVEFDESIHSTADPLNYNSNPVLRECYSKEDTEYVHEMISKLNEDDAEIIHLRAILSLDYVEISKIMNKNEDAVRKKYSRAIAELRLIIKEDEKQKYERNK